MGETREPRLHSFRPYVGPSSMRVNSNLNTSFFSPLMYSVTSSAMSVISTWYTSSGMSGQSFFSGTFISVVGDNGICLVVSDGLVRRYFSSFLFVALANRQIFLFLDD